MTWLQTYTGRRFEFETPLPDVISALDLAHALALTNRFGGHTRVPYSVAEHSVRVMLHVRRQVPDDLETQRLALLHDAAEAFVGDMVRGLKQRKDLAGYAWTERRVERAICQRFGVGDPKCAELPDLGALAAVKQADDFLLHWEARDLLPGGPVGWPEAPAELVYAPRLDPLGWEMAELWWLEMFAELFPRDREAPAARAARDGILQRGAAS